MFKTRLKELRNEKNISQLKLGKLLNLSQQAINKWENGKSEPDIENIKKLSEIFEVDPNYLICMTDDPTPAKLKENTNIEEFIKRQGITNEGYIKSLKEIIDLMKMAENNKMLDNNFLLKKSTTQFK